MADFFNLNSRWIVRGATKLRQTVCLVCRWSVDIWICFKCRPAYTYWRPKSTEGRRVYRTILTIGWWTTDRIRITLTFIIYRDRFMSDGQADDGMLKTFFICKLKQCPRGYRWIFSDCEIVNVIDYRLNQTVAQRSMIERGYSDYFWRYRCS